MTQREAVESVRGYLARTGGSEAKQVWLGLERALTMGEVRKALATLGAVSFVAGDWPKWNSRSEPVPAYVWDQFRGGGSYVSSRYLPGKFTMYRLPDMHE